MNKKYLAYYISRALLSAIFAVLIAGFSWVAIIIAIFMFGFFLLYLHSGWFKIENDKPFFPLRRDSRGQLIQRKALIIAILVGLLINVTLMLVSPNLDLSLVIRSITIPSAVIVYFISQFLLLSRA